jgi:hypothetical protein
LHYTEKDLQNFTEQIRTGLAIIKDFLTNQKDNDYADLKEHCKERKYVRLKLNEVSEAIRKPIERVAKWKELKKTIGKEMDKEEELIKKIMKKHME